MSPFLVFLNAARNLASMGMKREQVLDFAQREFGELTELMKSQIDNIYKPKKSVNPKDPDFDDTVVKMKFDDEGKPFNPKDPLKDYSKKDKKADGGRIGLRGGDAARSDAASGRNAGRADPSGGVERPSGGGRDDGPSNNFMDTTTKKKIIEGGKTATKNFITNKVFDKFGKVMGVNPKGAAILGIIGAIRRGTKKAPPGNLSMLDEEGILGLPESNLLAFEPGSIKDKQLKQMYNIFQETGMENPRMKGLMKEDIEQGGPLSLPEEAYQTAADGGRIGFNTGLSFPMKKDGFLMSPDFDKLTEEQKMYMEGMKIQEKMIQKKLKEILDKIKESMPENERNMKPVPMPDRALPDSLKQKGIKGLASGGRVGFKKGLLASMMEGLSPDGGIFQSIFANRKHPILSTLNATELLSLGEALRPVIGLNEGGRVGLKSGTGIFKGLKKFLMPGADDKLERQLLGTELGYEGLNNLMQLLQGSGLFASGGRVGLKDGPQDPKRRSILKMIGGGLMSLPILGKLKFLAPLAPTIKKAAERGIDVAPTYFFDLVNKIKMFGKQGKGAEDRVTEYNYKNYSLEENVSDGTQRITIKKGDPEVSYKEEVMEYTPPKMEEDIGQLPAQYDEVTVRPDMDGKMKDIEDGIDDISEILEEVKKSAPPIKKAAGRLAYMLGE